MTDAGVMRGEQSSMPNAAPPSRMPPIARLGFLLAQMNEAEQEVLLYIAERIHKGRETYGPLDPNDGRDWQEEKRQEMADWLVYHAIGEMVR